MGYDALVATILVLPVRIDDRLVGTSVPDAVGRLDLGRWTARHWWYGLWTHLATHQMVLLLLLLGMDLKVEMNV
jgi:hypothetical protein